jgi:ferredoxin-NADP reductase
MAATSVQAKVSSNQKVAPAFRLLKLDLEGPLAFSAGQFVTLAVPPEPGKDKALKGYYSVASPPSDLPRLELLVEHHESGPTSGWVSGWVAGLEPGRTVALEGPFGKFGLREARPKTYFLAEGAGLAPLRSMLRTLLKGPETSAPSLSLFLGTSAASSLLLDEEWKALQKVHPHFRYIPVLQTAADNPWMGKQADPADALLRHVQERTGLAIYMAGFNREVEPMLAKLLAAGFPKEDIHAERFG